MILRKTVKKINYGITDGVRRIVAFRKIDANIPVFPEGVAVK